jgi:ATP-dependent RNA helicase DHX36
LSVPGRLFPVTEKHLEDIWESLQQNHAGQLGFLESDPTITEYMDHESQVADLLPEVERKDRLAESVEALVNDAATTDGLDTDPAPSDDRDASSDEQLDSIVPVALAAAVIGHISKTTDQGAILTFLPGLDEILRLERSLRTDNPLGVDFEDTSRFKILLLHSSISSASQSEVFDSVPDGCRKVILATNIAETSVTIPDVRYVVDTGKLREKHYDPVRGITKLQCTWISKSNSKQRAGRAGRVQDGHYYALFSKDRIGTMRATGLPELLRSDLQEVCLDIKAQSFTAPIAEFLSDAIEPPPPQAVTHAIKSLQTLEALTIEEELTPLGRLLASL